MDKLLTVFTPTFNRAYCLTNLYQSLINQTNKNFEWIIVDDGSTDNTRDLIEKWIAEKKISIKYYFQSNSGKMVAHNLGVSKTQTELFVCIDSDDTMTKDAVELITSYWNKKNSPSISGLIMLKKIVPLKKKGTKRFEEIKTTLWDLYNKYDYSGETALIYKTDILKKFPFPQIKNEKFISESYIYNKIDDEYSMFFIPKEIFICEYRDDGYSKNINKILKNNPVGFSLVFNDLAKRHKKIRNKAGYCKLYIICSLLQRKRFIRTILDSSTKLICLAIFPLAFYLYIRCKKNEKFIIY